MRVRLSSGVLVAALLAGLLVGGAGPASAGVRSGPVASVPAGSLGPLGPLGPLTSLVVDRLLVADDVAAAKFGTDRPIDDPVREQQLLDRVRADAAVLGLDPDAAVRFFRDQIEANKQVQRGLFARWTAHPSEAPTTRPDLTVLRERLDRLTVQLLAELVRTQGLRQPDLRCRVDVTLAARSAATLRHLDGLHRRALGTATASVCA